MGGLMARSLRECGMEVSVADIRDGPCRWEAEASRCEAVMLAVPIPALSRLVPRLGRLMPGDSLLVDIASVKLLPMRLMEAHCRGEYCGLHPVFGPGRRAPDGGPVVVCRGRHGALAENMLAALRGMGLELYGMTAEEHDRMMASTVLLRQAVLLVAAHSMRKLGLRPGKPPPQAGDAFAGLAGLVERQMREDPGLWADMVGANPYWPGMIRSLAGSAAAVAAAYRDRQALQELIGGAAPPGGGGE
jgi:prephenate dehydrogenase